jgi:hypothetical protein
LPVFVLPVFGLRAVGLPVFGLPAFGLPAFGLLAFGLPFLRFRCRFCSLPLPFVVVSVAVAVWWGG